MNDEKGGRPDWERTTSTPPGVSCHDISSSRSFV